MQTKNSNAAPNADVSGDNFPGFQYLQRVINSVSQGMMAQAEELNTAWSKIRRDEGYGVKDALNTWTRLVDNSFGVVMEVVQPLGPRPNWLVYPWSPSNKPSPETSVAVDGPAETDSALDYSEFFGVGNTPSRDLYMCAPRREGTRVHIEFDPAVLEELALKLKKGKAADYISFIYRKAQGPAPPLVIVVVRLKND